MATASFNKESMMQILEEMRQLFPQVPEHIVQSYVNQCQSDKNTCCKLLEMYVSNQSFSHKNSYVEQSASEVPVGWQTFGSPVTNRSQSFNFPSIRESTTEKPRSAPVENVVSYYPPGDFRQYSSYYGRPPVFLPRYPPYVPSQRHHVSTLEIPPQAHTSRVEIQLHPPVYATPHQQPLSVSTNGPFSHPMQRPLNSRSGSRSPRTSPRPQASPTTANDRETFVQALLKYQGDRYQQLYRELALSKDTLQNLKSEVNKLEESLQNRATYSGNISSSGAEVLQSMRNEITKLRVECHCLSVEADICSKEQTQQGGDFYQNIFTGQVGPIPPVSSNKNSENQIEDNEGSKWKCMMCTFHNHPALNSCEMCEMPRKQIERPKRVPPNAPFRGHVQIQVTNPRESTCNPRVELRYTRSHYH